MVEIDAEQILNCLPGRMACTVTYDGASLSPAVKGQVEGEWQTETYGEGTSYEFSVWITAASGNDAGVKAGKAITVDSTDYKIMSIDKGDGDNVLWRIDLESVYG